MTHWCYGSGINGCLYDNGPHFVSSKHDAIDGALLPFIDDMSEREYRHARVCLSTDGAYYFARPQEMGADYVEIAELEGPCPEEE